jgi:hypothetical protein
MEKKNECEKYQLDTIKLFTQTPLITKTNLRFNMIDYTLTVIDISGGKNITLFFTYIFKF